MNEIAEKMKRQAESKAALLWAQKNSAEIIRQSQVNVLIKESRADVDVVLKTIGVKRSKCV